MDKENRILLFEKIHTVWDEENEAYDKIVQLKMTAADQKKTDVAITEEGIRLARILLSKYNIKDTGKDHRKINYNESLQTISVF